MEWAIRDPKRFLRERDELEKLAQSAEWIGATKWKIRKNADIAVDVDLIIHGEIYAATLTYPDVFPDTLPYVRPRDGKAWWTPHQYGPGGSLCLEWRADNWNPGVTGAQIIRSAYDLLSTENHPELPAEVPSAHQLTRGQEMRSSNYRLVLTSQFLSRVGMLFSGQWIELQARSFLHLSARELTTICLVTATGSESTTKDQIADVPEGIRVSSPLFAWSGTGLAVKSDFFESNFSAKTVEDLVSAIYKAGLKEIVPFAADSSGKYQDQTVIVSGTEGLFRAFVIDGGELHEYGIIEPEANTRRLPEDYAPLSGLQVCIVGLGSIGSKVALSLARSGVRRFLLIDDDILLPGNLTRHELSWAYVGVHKAEATREALRLIAPDVDVRVHVHRFAGQESAMFAASILKEISGSDMIIDATANPAVFLRLASLARTYKKTLCWGELFAGGIGGLIARARPDIDPNPLAVRGAINAHLASLPPAPFVKAEGYDDAESAEPLVADDGDVTQVSSALTRFALDAALQRTPSTFPFSAYLIGLKKEWVFTQPFDTQPIEVTGPGWGDENALENIDDDSRAEVLGVLLSIVKQGADDHAESSQGN